MSDLVWQRQKRGGDGMSGLCHKDSKRCSVYGRDTTSDSHRLSQPHLLSLIHWLDLLAYTGGTKWNVTVSWTVLAKVLIGINLGRSVKPHWVPGKSGVRGEIHHITVFLSDNYWSAPKKRLGYGWLPARHYAGTRMAFLGFNQGRWQGGGFPEWCLNSVSVFPGGNPVLHAKQVKILLDIYLNNWTAVYTR